MQLRFRRMSAPNFNFITGASSARGPPIRASPLRVSRVLFAVRASKVEASVSSKSAARVVIAMRDDSVHSVTSNPRDSSRPEHRPEHAHPVDLRHNSGEHVGKIGTEVVIERLWNARLTSRRTGMGTVFARLASDGRLRPGITVEEAAEIAWAIASPHQYEYLVIERGWPIDRYRAHLELTITGRLLTTSRGSRSQGGPAIPGSGGRPAGGIPRPGGESRRQRRPPRTPSPQN